MNSIINSEKHIEEESDKADSKGQGISASESGRDG